MSKTALAWALTHVVHPGDCITLLAVFNSEKYGKKFWNFPRLAGDCGSNRFERLPDRICEISENCSQMVLQFHNQIEVGVRIKVVSSTPGSVVAAEARRNGATWVVLDKKLKQEMKHCIEELQCNIVVMKGSQAKVLRLNLGCSNEIQTPYYSAASSPGTDIGKLLGHRMKHSTPVSSPEEQRPNDGKYTSKNNRSIYDDQPRAMYSDGERIISLSADPISAVTSDQKSVYWIPQNHIVDEKALLNRNRKNTCEIKSPTSRTLLDKFVQYDQDARAGRLDHSHQEKTVSSGIRHAVSSGRTSSMPPPLCSLCQHKAPTFGKPPRQFSFEELDEATEGFSDVNFLAEGNKRPPLDWNLRMKIAIGTARGLRYLHEDCRVGCVVHRDMRPNNILVTHDFEPLVADFGLARWHAECNISSEGRVNRTSGYLAPEYSSSSGK
ncbi:hypothetical protein OIU84_012906 [Salix udensis]|uniref:non-specific serine/threonine protein kinase n=1 Tax=Salix udensis TaxID=889485 RepID=A0AAD6JH34_9ROSI|nr:hypothetical protein OIU84_012906 [Salix udensis]